MVIAATAAVLVLVLLLESVSSIGIAPLQVDITKVKQEHNFASRRILIAISTNDE